MTRYLLDTHVVSEIRKTRPHGAVVAWLGSLHGGQVCVSAVTLGELQAGIEMTRAQDATKSRILTEGLDEIAQSQEILPMDGPCFREWARLKHRLSDTIFQEAMIAATTCVLRTNRGDPQ